MKYARIGLPSLPQVVTLSISHEDTCSCFSAGITFNVGVILCYIKLLQEFQDSGLPHPTPFRHNFFVWLLFFNVCSEYFHEIWWVIPWESCLKIVKRCWPYRLRGDKGHTLWCWMMLVWYLSVLRTCSFKSNIRNWYALDAGNAGNADSRKGKLRRLASVQELVNTAGEDLAERTELAWWPRFFFFATYCKNSIVLIAFNGDDMWWSSHQGDTMHTRACTSGAITLKLYSSGWKCDLERTQPKSTSSRCLRNGFIRPSKLGMLA